MKDDVAETETESGRRVKSLIFDQYGPVAGLRQRKQQHGGPAPTPRDSLFVFFEHFNVVSFDR